MNRPSDSRVWTRSLRFRLTLWYTGILAVILIGAAVMVFFGAQHTLQSETDGFLANEAHRLMQDTAAQPGEAPDPEDLREAVATSDALPGSSRSVSPSRHLLFDVVYLRLLPQAGGPSLASSASLAHRPTLTASLDTLRRPAPDAPEFAFVGPDDEQTMRVLTTPVRLGPDVALVQVAVLWDHNADLLERLATLLLTGVPTVLALAALGGWALVGSTLRPIGRIVAEAERLDAADLPEALLPAAAETDGEIGHLVATLNRMTMRLRRAFNAQRQFGEAQQRFAADASHELRTPLTILRGEMEVALSRPRAPETYRATLASAVEEIAHLSRIVEGLSFLARRDAGPINDDAYRREVALGALCQVVAAEFRPLARVLGIRLQLRIDGDRPHVQGNADQLQQLLRNLVDNALKHTPSGGTVTVCAGAAEEQEATVTVRDTGIGIAPDDLPRVFDRFWRADRSRSGAGSGLGLAICAEIAQAHGGRMDAESRLGVGSCFTLRLPAGGPA